MRRLSFLLLSILLPLSSRAGMPVTDAALIASNERNNALDYALQIVQEANQQTQILRLVDQIQQVEDYLDRFGDPEELVAIGGVAALLTALETPNASRTSEAIVAEVSGRDALVEDGLGLYNPVGQSVRVDGVTAANRSADFYKPEDASTKAIEHYREVRQDVLTRRTELKAALRKTTAQLQHATTASEVQKLTGILIGLQTELGAVDRELDFAMHEALSRSLENSTAQERARKAQIEDERTKLRVSTAKDVESYRLMTGPIYFTQD